MSNKMYVCFVTVKSQRLLVEPVKLRPMGKSACSFSDNDNAEWN